MISQEQNTKIMFHAIETKDILALSSLMDKLVANINEQHKYIESHKESSNDYWMNEYNKELPQMIEQYKILSTLGFVSTKSLNEGIKLS